MEMKRRAVRVRSAQGKESKSEGLAKTRQIKLNNLEDHSRQLVYLLVTLSKDMLDGEHLHFSCHISDLIH